MEIRTLTIKYSKHNAKKMRDEETALQLALIDIQNSFTQIITKVTK